MEVVLLGLYYLLSAQLAYGATCAGTENTWMMSQGQSPCDLYQALIRLCLPTWTVDVIKYGEQYASGTDACGCNTVAASLAAACSDCQTAGTYNGPLYSQYLTVNNNATHWCTSITNGSISPEVTLPSSLKTQIPGWAWIDINSSNGYWSYSESYSAYHAVNSVSQSPPQSTLSILEQSTSSTSEQPTSSVNSISQSPPQSTLSILEQSASPTSEQPTSSTLGQLTSFVTYITTATATPTNTVANSDTETLPLTDSPTNTFPLTFIRTETTTQVPVVTGEPAIQTSTSLEPSAAVVQNADNGINATWAIVGSILGAVASIATIWMCIRMCGGRGGAH